MDGGETMDLIPFFSTAILIATIASIILAVSSYAAYKLRERRRPNRNFPEGEVREAVFFHRYEPGERRMNGTDGAGRE
jgi:hypothetical protein